MAVELLLIEQQLKRERDRWEQERQYKAIQASTPNYAYYLSTQPAQVISYSIPTQYYQIIEEVCPPTGPGFWARLIERLVKFVRRVFTRRRTED